MNFYRASYLLLLATCLVSCGEFWQQSAKNSDPADNLFEQSEEVNSLKSVFGFMVSHDGSTYVLNDMIFSVKVKGVCSDSTTTMDFEHNISSNRFPVGASFPPEFLLNLFKSKSVNIWGCDLIVYPLDKTNKIIQEIPPGKISINLNRNMNFGITAPVGTRIPSRGYTISDMASAMIVMDDVQGFEEPREETVLTLICDNGSGELLRRMGAYSPDDTNVISGHRIVNVFTEDPFDMEESNRNILIIKDWLGESNSHCIITNSIEGSPYLLWSYVIDYLYY